MQRDCEVGRERVGALIPYVIHERLFYSAILYAGLTISYDTVRSLYAGCTKITLCRLQ